MRPWRVAVIACALSLPALAPQSVSGLERGSHPGSVSEPPAQAGMRTVCIGQRRDGVRSVGCFDVYRLDIGPIFDPAKNTDLHQYVWKWTAEAEGGEKRRLVRLGAEVTSDAGTTYNWSPGASIEMSEPGAQKAFMATDIVAESSDGGPPKLSNPTDGYVYQALAGWIDPKLGDRRFATYWTAPQGRTAPRGASAQVAGASVWGAPAPGPELLPARLRIEVIYR